MEAAMWRGGLTDWIVLGSGYVLAIGFFYVLGGVERAAEAMRRWGRSSATPPRSREER